MKRYKVLIVDDESPARDELKHILSGIDFVKVAAEASNGFEALRKIDKTLPDILLLDIEMPGLNGIEVAKKILKKKSKPAIIFATAYDAYAVAAFEVNAIDYVLKPFDSKRIEKALIRVKELLESKTDPSVKIEDLIRSMSKGSGYQAKVPIKLKGKISLLDTENIVYARAEAGLVFISDEGKEYLSDFASLEKLEKQLDPNTFVRTHRSYLVNIERMKEIVPLGAGHYTIKCRTSTGRYLDIPLSRRQAKDLKEKLKF